jgi:hypothetical protein
VAILKERLEKVRHLPGVKPGDAVDASTCPRADNARIYDNSAAEPILIARRARDEALQVLDAGRWRSIERVVND